VSFSDNVDISRIECRFANQCGNPYRSLRAGSIRVVEQRSSLGVVEHKVICVQEHSKPHDPEHLGIQRASRTELTEELNDQWAPAATVLKDGGYVVAWVDSGLGFKPYSRLYSSTGVPKGDAFLLSEVFDSAAPGIAGLSGGGFVAVGIGWQDDNVWARAFDGQGSPLGAAFRVNADTLDYYNRPDVCALDDGGFVVTWTASPAVGPGSRVYCQRFDALGNKTGDEFRVGTYPDVEQSSSAVAVIGNGGFVVVWTAYHQPGGNFYDICAQRYALCVNLSLDTVCLG